jgi:transcriptional regulator with XRE-family HTH domain
MKPEVAKTVQIFPAALKRLRERANLRQVQVSWKTGLSKAQISSFETGKVLPSIGSLLSYLNGVGADFSDLQKALNGESLLSFPLPGVSPLPHGEGDQERVVGRAFLRSFKVLLQELGLEPGASANDAIAQGKAQPRPGSPRETHSAG